MRRLAAVALLLASCFDDRPTPRYWSCDESSTCADGTTCEPIHDETYCTTTCYTHEDCTASGWPSVCLSTKGAAAGLCMGECWPTHPGELEDLAFCRRYGFLCPSDCDAQGLTCDYVGTWPPRYGCI